MTGSSAPTISYGPHPDQVGDLYDSGRPGPLLCLLHGGFWRMPYDRQELDPIARDLHTRGYSVWNLEYRRVGSPGVAWPTPGLDVLAAIDHAPELRTAGGAPRWTRVVLIGHSAGGHLALWAAAERAVHIAIGLAPITDLDSAYRERLGSGAVAALLGGSPEERRDAYAAASPRARLPLGTPSLIIHGTEDTAVPIDQSRAFVAAGRAAGDRAELLEITGAEHMAHLDPASPSHAALCRSLSR